MYRLIQPDPRLAPYIETYWSVYPEPGENIDLSVEVFVDGKSDLILNFGVPYTRTRLGERPQLVQASNLDAQRRYPIVIRQAGEVEIVGVRFVVGGLAPFCRQPVSEFTDRTLGLERVFGAEGLALESSVRAAGPDLEQQKGLLDAFFSEQLKPISGYQMFRQMLERLEGGGGTLSTADLSKEFAMTPRSVGRHFQQGLGLAPSLYSRIVRFQSALASLMDGPDGTLGQLAADCGYFDHAHFVKDFKVFAGGIPGRFRQYFPQAGPDDFAPNVVQFVQDAGADSE